MGTSVMQSTRGKSWRHGLFDGSSGRTEREGEVVSSEAPPPEARRQGGQRVWAFLCPNPTCDTELVVFPEYAGATVQCPTCGFAFLAPRVVPLQIASDSEGAGVPPASRPFAPGARMVRPAPAPPAPPPRPKAPAARPAGASASGAASCEAAAADPKPKAAPADVAAQMPKPSADGTKALEALARSVGSGVRPPAPATSASAASAGAEAGPRAAASSEALRALALAAAEPEAEAARKRAGRGAKGRGLSAPMASAAFEGDRRRSSRIQTAGDPSAAAPLPLSEGERTAARQQRADLVVTWAVAAIVSAVLALAAFISGVPDIGLGSLLFLGLAGARTWWITRSKGKGGGPQP